jgi:hypothetical protein
VSVTCTQVASGDQGTSTVGCPAPTPRQCQIVTERGAVHFDATHVGVARRIPLEAFRRFDADVRIRHGQGADRRGRDLAVHAEKQQMMRSLGCRNSEMFTLRGGW